VDTRDRKQEQQPTNHSSRTRDTCSLRKTINGINSMASCYVLSVTTHMWHM